MPTHVSFTIIPAAPGHFLVYDTEDGGVVADEEVIAWRVETERIHHDLHSTVHPITVTGEAASNAVGALYPNGKVTLFMDGELHPDLASAAASLKRRFRT